MDRLAEVGAEWFCTGAHILGSASLEMMTCGSPSSQFTIGLFTIAAVVLLCLFTVWRIIDGRR